MPLLRGEKGPKFWLEKPKKQKNLCLQWSVKSNILQKMLDKLIKCLRILSIHVQMVLTVPALLLDNTLFLFVGWQVCYWCKHTPNLTSSLYLYCCVTVVYLLQKLKCTHGIYWRVSSNTSNHSGFLREESQIYVAANRRVVLIYVKGLSRMRTTFTNAAWDFQLGFRELFFN